MGGYHDNRFPADRLASPQISKEHKDKFRFEHYVAVVRAEWEQAGKASGQPLLSELCFFNFEDEVLVKASTAWYALSRSGNAAGDKQIRIVMFLSAKELSTCVPQIAQLLA